MRPTSASEEVARADQAAVPPGAPGVNQVGSRAAEITDQLVYSVEYGGTPDDPSAHLA
jgi:hypothetical protein